MSCSIESKIGLIYSDRAYYFNDDVKVTVTTLSLYMNYASVSMCGTLLRHLASLYEKRTYRTLARVCLRPALRARRAAFSSPIVPNSTSIIPTTAKCWYELDIPKCCTYHCCYQCDIPTIPLMNALWHC